LFARYYSVQRARHPPSSVLSISFLLGLNDGPTTVPHYYTLEIWPSINLAHRWPPAFDHADNCTARPQPAPRPTTCLCTCAVSPGGDDARVQSDGMGRVVVSPTTTGLGARSHLARHCTRLLRCRAAGRPDYCTAAAGDETLVTVGAR
jgi:hypothetical protein